MKRDQLRESILHVEMWIEFSRLRGESNGGYLQTWKLPSR